MKKGDIVLVATFAGVDVHVKLKEYCSYPARQKQVAYAGWRTELIYEEDAEALRKNGCPTKIGDESWVYDWQILDNAKHLDNALNKCKDRCLTEYEEEIELYKTYGGD